MDEISAEQMGWAFSRAEEPREDRNKRVGRGKEDIRSNNGDFAIAIRRGVTRPLKPTYKPEKKRAVRTYKHVVIKRCTIYQ
jgi:hypothetical protein